MKTFIPYKKVILTKLPYYQRKDPAHKYLLHMCKTCGYPLGTHFNGPIDFTTQEEYDGICPLPENGKNLPRHYHGGITHAVEPVFYSEELNTKVKVL